MKSTETAVSIDNLQDISGVGKGSEKALHEAEIMTFSDVAGRSAEELSEITGISANRIKNEDWRGQAKSKKPKEEDELSNGQHYATFKVKLMLEEDNQVRYTDIIYAQGRKAGNWAGWDTKQMIVFFEEHAGIETKLANSIEESIDSTEADSIQETLPEEITPVLHKLDICIPKTDAPRRIIHQRDDFDIHFELELPNFKDEGIVSEATIYARSLSGKSRLKIGRASEPIKNGFWDSKMKGKGLDSDTYRLEVELDHEAIPEILLAKKPIEGGILVVI